MSSRVILAISGGIDSVVLLDRYIKQHGTHDVIVAHVDHGIRTDSSDDAKFVEALAAEYGVQFESVALGLGHAASEDAARIARYMWLRDIMREQGADLIVTAHHQDDVLETIINNISRGTRWRGLCSMRSTSEIWRPLLGTSKAEIATYALEHDLKWREDSTNQDTRFSRNYIRHVYMPRLSAKQRSLLFDLYEKQCLLRDKIERETDALFQLASDNGEISRYWLVMLEDVVSDELIQHWLGQSMMMPTLERIKHFAATAQFGARIDVENGLQLVSTTRHLVVKPSGI